MERKGQIRKQINEKRSPENKGYRNKLAAIINSIRGIDAGFAKKTLDNEKDGNEYKKHKTEDKTLERKILGLDELDKLIDSPKHGEFVELDMSKINTVVRKEALFNVLISPEKTPSEKEVFVSVGNNYGFELLRAIDLELKNSKKNFCIYQYGSLNVPFQDMSKEDIDNIIKYEKGETIDLIDAGKYQPSPSYSGISEQEKYHIGRQLRENKCDLVNEWESFLKTHFEQSGFYVEKYTTHGNLYDMDHAYPKSDKNKIEKLFKDFLAKKGVDIVGVANIENIPFALQKLHILSNKSVYESPYMKRWNYDNKLKEFNEKKENTIRNIVLRSVSEDKYSTIKN